VGERDTPRRHLSAVGPCPGLVAVPMGCQGLQGRFTVFCITFISLVGRRVGGLRITILPETLRAFVVYPVCDVGLAPGAVVSLNITNALPSNGTVLVILSHGQWVAWVNQHPKPLPGGSLSSYLVSHWRQPFAGELIARVVIRAPKPDRYYVVILNLHQEAMVLGGTITYVNPSGQHLPLQLAHVPEALWASSAAFVLLLLVAVLLLSSIWQKEATLLHMLLVACLWLKSAALLMKWKYFSVMERQGQAPTWLLQAWKLASKLHEICEIFLLLITALGWRVLRPRLTSTEIRFAALAMVLATTLATLQVCSETGTDEPFVSFGLLGLLFYVVRVMCYLVIIFAMNFNLQLIAVHLAESPVTTSIAVLYRKQQAYVGFRRIFLAIVFRPSALLWLQLSVLDEEGTQWAVDAVREASVWFIYAGLFITLRPGMAQSRLLKLVRAVIASDVSLQSSEGGGSAPARMPPGAAAATASVDSGGDVGARLRGMNPAEADDDLGVPYVQLAGGA